MGNHTPGPWILDECLQGWQLLANGLDVFAQPVDCTDADARLIAASPELLEMVQTLRKDLWSLAILDAGNIENYIAEMDDLISKATGEGDANVTG